MTSWKYHVDITLRCEYICVLTEVKTHDFGIRRCYSEEKKRRMTPIKADFHD